MCVSVCVEWDRNLLNALATLSGRAHTHTHTHGSTGRGCGKNHRIPACPKNVSTLFGQPRTSLGLQHIDTEHAFNVLFSKVKIQTCLPATRNPPSVAVRLSRYCQGMDAPSRIRFQVGDTFGSGLQHCGSAALSGALRRALHACGGLLPGGGGMQHPVWGGHCRHALGTGATPRHAPTGTAMKTCASVVLACRKSMQRHGPHCLTDYYPPRTRRRATYIMHTMRSTATSAPRGRASKFSFPLTNTLKPSRPFTAPNAVDITRSTKVNIWPKPVRPCDFL